MQKPKGTYDVYNELGSQVLQIEEIFKYLMLTYNYQYMRTPIFESSELFHRTVGETSDIVSKETYDFKDRGDRNMTLRPEGTAGIVRSFIENKLYADSITKCWYYGPMFRYERPQAGRFREFYQLGVEAFGSNSPLLDAEVISIPYTFFKLLGLKDIRVSINSLGDSESKENYRKALVEHFKKDIKELCPDCQERYLKNPLRILDCKVDKDHKLLKSAPKMIDYLSDSSLKHLNDLKEALEALEIDYVINPNLVRGLDYYTETVFEIESLSESFGSNNVLCGGGRYNNLVHSLGGPETKGVGFALGLERVIQALKLEDIDIKLDTDLDILIIPVSDKEAVYASQLLMTIRSNGFKADMTYVSKNIKTNFKLADKYNSKYILIIGEEEINKNIYKIKNNKTKEEIEVDKDYLLYFLEENTDGEANE